MCGIAGIWLRRPARPEDREDLRRMVAALRHRGPDAEGFLETPQVLLGHRRLSIIDLSEEARQPLANEDETAWIVCNGEVYNHRDLRAELEAQGHAFRSGSDSEVILHLLEQGGVAALSRLRGMYAFAAYDARRGELVLGRDRLGQKPLVMRDEGDRVLFASELGALHAGTRGPLALDPVALQELLALGYVPHPRSIVAGSEKLPPARFAVLQGDAPARIERYWELQAGPKRSAATSVERARLEAELLEALDESVRLRLMSDVPLGAYLSGGIDSSAVVAAMRAVGAPRILSFSMGFAERAYDERAHALEVARALGTEHRAWEVAPPSADELLRLLGLFGEPFADSSALPCLRLAARTREEVTVALSGDGADELFGGYLRHLADGFAAGFDGLPRWLRHGALATLLRLLPRRQGRDDPLLRARRFLERVAEPDAERRSVSWSPLLAEAALSALMRPELRAACAGHDPLARPLAAMRAAPGCEPGERTLMADLGCYLPDDLLVKVDITSMAHGLEVRAPFLDHRLVELAARLPASQKAHHGQTKRILKRALRRRLPASILGRPKKGFAVPLKRWLRGPLQPLLRERLGSPQARCHDLLEPAAVRALVDEHARGEADWSQPLWALLALEVWLGDIGPRLQSPC